ncbi:hypothetical protein MP228_009746 [Amoeboaphelidium protococcarum]|nr:hypothetical protein MP228_009746 [Amoeboaphelidium protococcarum]
MVLTDMTNINENNKRLVSDNAPVWSDEGESENLLKKQKIADEAGLGQQQQNENITSQYQAHQDTLPESSVQVVPIVHQNSNGISHEEQAPMVINDVSSVNAEATSSVANASQMSDLPPTLPQENIDVAQPSETIIQAEQLTQIVVAPQDEMQVEVNADIPQEQQQLSQEDSHSKQQSNEMDTATESQQLEPSHVAESQEDAQMAETKPKDDNLPEPEAMNSVTEEQPAQTAQQSSSSGSPVSEVLHKAQMQWCKNTLRTLKRHGDALPFLAPVDPIALGIPTYFDVIKNPMDISTIDRKMSSQQYSNYQQFVDDVKLMLDNCFTFNPPDHPVYNSALNLQKYFNAAYKRLPLSDGAIESPKKRPTSEELAERRKSARSAEDMKMCQNIWKEMMKPLHRQFMFPFYQPVDPVALNIPTYFDIIKEPMDLSTMKKRLDSGHYQSAEEFEADFRLMINNCLTFNRPGDAVYTMGQRALEIFEKKWNDRHKTNQRDSHSHKAAPVQTSSVAAPVASSHPPAPKAVTKRPKYAEVSDGGESSSDDDNDIQVQLLENQIMFLQSQLEALKRKKRKDKKKKSRRSSKSENPKPVGRPPNPFKQPKVPRPRKQKKEMVIREITFEEKQTLSDAISEFPESKLGVVLKIIQEGLPHLKDAPQEEIEIEMDLLDNLTLNKLWNYVMGKKQKKQKSSAADPQAAAERIMELNKELAILDGRVPTQKKSDINLLPEGSASVGGDNTLNSTDNMAIEGGMQSNQNLSQHQASSSDEEEDDSEDVDSDLE